MKTDVLILLETCNFEELSSDERTAVLKEMTEAAYKQERKFILQARLLAEEEKGQLTPNPEILRLAQQKLKGKKKAVAPLFIRHRVPTWAAVAACILLYFGLWSYFNSDLTIGGETVVTETIYDTIYTEKIITEHVQLLSDTVVEYVYVNNEPEIIYEVADNTNDYIQEEPSYDNLFIPQDQYCNIMSCFEAKKGNSAANDSWLKLAH